MSMYIKCDWCGRNIESGVATLQIDGQHADASYRPLTKIVRHFHAGAAWDRDSCFTRVLRMLDGEQLAEPSAGFEWKLVPTSESRRFRGTQIALGTTPLAVLGLKVSTQRTLEVAGVLTVEHAADLRQRGEQPWGTGPRRTLELDKALLEHGFLGGATAIESEGL